ncbi:MAG: hypothetical protein V3575_05635 [Candidatus Absconditabacteria bacterium]
MNKSNHRFVMFGIIGITLCILGGCSVSQSESKINDNGGINQRQRQPRNGGFGSGDNMGGRRNSQKGMIGTGENLSGSHMRGERPMNGEIMSGNRQKDTVNKEIQANE